MQMCDGIAYEAERNGKEILEISVWSKVISRLAVFKCWKCFKEGNKMVIDDVIGRGSSTPITDVGIRQLMYW